MLDRLFQAYAVEQQFSFQEVLLKCQLPK
jgi:hypothetical protein